MRIIVILLALGVANAAAAQTAIPKSLFSSDGQLMTSGTTQINANFGDVFIGASAGGTTEVQHGFWTTPNGQIVGVDRPAVTFVTYLGMPSPNPAKGSVFIEFGLPMEERISLRIYDIHGRAIRELVNGNMNAGVFRQTWDLCSSDGTKVATGIYFYRLSTSSFRAVRKIVVID